MVAIALDGGLDVGGVRRCHLRLRHCVAGADFTREQRLEPSLFQLRRTVALQHLHVAGVGRRAVENFRGHGGASHDLAQRSVLQIGEPGAELALRQEQIPQPGRARLGFQLFDYRDRLPAVRTGGVLVIARLIRIDVPIHERAHSLLKVSYFF